MVTVVTRWDVERSKKPSYKTAVSSLTSKRKGTPLLITMREWLNKIIKQPSTDFFHRNSKQERSFNDLKRISIQNCPSKSAR